MWARSLLLFSITASMHAQQDAASLLRRAQAKIVASLDRLPRFMCTETVDRTQYAPDLLAPGTACDETSAPRSTHLITSDRLRLDVAQSSNKEMYSWVGESRFDDRAITDIIQDGAISDGTFTGYLSLIFHSADAAFTYTGETTRNGRALSEFRFDVPREKSRYSFSDGQNRVITGYGGTLLVDPQSADLVQLSVHTSRLPPETSACYTSTTLDYTSVSLNDADFLLPSVSLFHVLDANGSTSENRTVLSNCHEFLGEASLRFDSPQDAAAALQQPTQALVIPPGLSFRVAFTQAIDTATAATGDLVKGKLITPIREGSKVFLPSGTAVRVRIVRIRQHYGGAPSVALELRMESITAHSIRNPLGNLQLVFRNHLIGSGLESAWVTAATPSGTR